MKTKDIRNMGLAYLQVQEKAKMDPVNKDELKGTHAQRKDKDIDNDGKVDSTDKYLHARRKAISSKQSETETVEAKEYGPGHIGAVQKMLDKEREAKKAKDAMKKEEVDLDEAAPKMKPDFIKTQREKDRAHDAAMGRTPTGRKKPMTSTQRSMASMRKESADLDEAYSDAHRAKMAKSYKGKNPHHINALSSDKGTMSIVTNNGNKYSVTAKETGGKMPKPGDHINKWKPGSVKEEVSEDAQVKWPIYYRMMERKDHGNMDNGSPKGEGLSPSAKTELSRSMGDSGIDGAKAAEFTAKSATSTVKVAPGRPNDNKMGDKKPIDSTKA
jgi:hypothetical protein